MTTLTPGNHAAAKLSPAGLSRTTAAPPRGPRRIGRSIGTQSDRQPERQPDLGRARRVAANKFPEVDEAELLHALFAGAMQIAVRFGRTRLSIAKAVGVSLDCLDAWCGPKPNRTWSFEAIAIMLRTPHVLGVDAHAYLRAGVQQFMYGADAESLTPDALRERALVLAADTGDLVGVVADVTSPDSEAGAAISEREALHVAEAADAVVEGANGIGMGVGQ